MAPRVEHCRAQTSRGRLGPRGEDAKDAKGIRRGSGDEGRTGWSRSPLLAGRRYGCRSASTRRRAAAERTQRGQSWLSEALRLERERGEKEGREMEMVVRPGQEVLVLVFRVLLRAMPSSPAPHTPRERLSHPTSYNAESSLFFYSVRPVFVSLARLLWRPQPHLLRAPAPCPTSSRPPRTAQILLDAGVNQTRYCPCCVISIYPPSRY